MLRISVLAAALFLVTGTGGLFAADDVLTDDFSVEVEGRWESVSTGATPGEWTIRDGRVFHAGKESPDHDMLLADFPFSEGMIEVAGIARAQNKHNFASLGIVIKYVDEMNRIYFRFGSYGGKLVDGRAPAFDKVLLPTGQSGQPELGRHYDLTVVVRHGMIGVCIDDVIIGVMRDPLAGKTGRPGLFTESEVEYDNLRVTRYAP